MSVCWCVHLIYKSHITDIQVDMGFLLTDIMTCCFVRVNLQSSNVLTFWEFMALLEIKIGAFALAMHNGEYEVCTLV